MIVEKRISVDFGRMAYYQIEGKGMTILFIHNTNSTKDWAQQEKNALPAYNWIIPDLIGFGNSTRDENLDMFSIHQYAKDLKKLIEDQNIEKLVLIGLGLGGLIAHELANNIKEKVKAVFHIMTPFDKTDIADNYGQLKYEDYLKNYNEEIARFTRLNTPVSRMIVQHLRKIGPFSIWAVHKKIDEYLDSFTMNEINYELHYLVGDGVRGNLQSEKLMKKASHHVSIISDSQFNPHIENPKGFWTYISDCLENF